ncbi:MULTISPECIES: thioredoxin domain-containing protein [unclassified Curtobacterium]|uniref:DsbA family protein n=1 Tax=unclassified Curtobacterium TaxID=257496 RepID=UPI000F4CE196|nr:MULTISPECIES: thioredoxin domain-containing protein [unclassified Curtobacterium]NQW91073.1 thioredoxin domain-containing protein [Curtobacterium sp. VKM Ac-2861]ROS59891.1 protein-disulfide isomerase [Curtobacterium sp. PhB172]TCL78206.1 protein-disulfide isomerase [Curtobacterium sp. PhB128]TCL94931.1 protein-disulfide isomerase [Curtobacterium sp. PhB138]TCU51065.1 protein-disulfide isomerase [Curtobacterium sp. PhB146]
MTNNDRPTKNERRQHAREVSRQRADAEKRRKRRNKWFLQGGIGLGIIAIAAIITLVVVNVNNAPAVSAAGPKNMATGAIQFTGEGGEVTPVTTKAVTAKGTPSAVPTSNTDGAVAVTEYVDWACPVCKQFEAAYADQILDKVKSGDATLAIQPVSILDRSYQSSRYASRAANAAMCVANYAPDKFLDVQTQFFDNQPTEGTSGLTNAEIAKLVKAGGATGSNVSECLSTEQFKGWVTKSTKLVTADEALQGTQGFGTPTVVVNGKRLDDLSTVITAIDAAAK